MEATVCQAVEINAAVIAADAHDQADTISTLSSTEMSFVGGGLIAVAFA